MATSNMYAGPLSRAPRRSRVKQEGRRRNDKAVNRSAVSYVIVRTIAVNGAIGSPIRTETNGQQETVDNTQLRRYLG